MKSDAQTIYEAGILARQLETLFPLICGLSIITKAEAGRSALELRDEENRSRAGNLLKVRSIINELARILED